MTELDLRPGTVVWAVLDPVYGREQGGHRPCVVIASPGYLAAATTLAFIAPVTTVDRGWPNHVPVGGPAGLNRPSWVMAEQARVISRERITGVAGEVSVVCLESVRLWVRDFLDL